MRLVDSAGTLRKERRYASSAASVQDDEVTSPTKLSELLRGLMRRVTELEARVPPEGLEFEVNVGTTGALTSIAHNLNSQVRWWVTTWVQQDNVAYPVTAPILVQDSTSDVNTLVLRSYVTGRAIVRIEPAFAGIDMGMTVVTALPRPSPIDGLTTKAMADANQELTAAELANPVIRITGALTADRTLSGFTRPANDTEAYTRFVWNNTTGGVNTILSDGTNTLAIGAGGQFVVLFTNSSISVLR